MVLIESLRVIGNLELKEVVSYFPSITLKVFSKILSDFEIKKENLSVSVVSPERPVKSVIESPLPEIGTNNF